MNDSMVTPSSLATEPRRRSHIAAVIESSQRRPIILVLGMHRSGTSLCSHILSMLGIDMADKVLDPGSASPGPDNPRGHWERWEIVAFHDRILDVFNRGHATPYHDLPLPVAWWADPRVAEVRRDIVKFLQKRMGEEYVGFERYFGFKDPRTIRLMPMWHQILKELRLAPKMVFCLRNPAQVARSLTARDHLDHDVAEYRWFAYVADFFRYTNGFDFCTVEYERWFDEPSFNLRRLKNFLELRWDQTEPDLELALTGIVDPTLRHDDPTRPEAVQPLVRSLYKLASRAGEDTAAREQIHRIVSQFISFQQLHTPLQHAFEHVAPLAAELPRIEQEAAALGAALSERGSMVDAANAKASSLASERDQLAAALETVRTDLLSAQSVVAETQRASNALQATLAGREVALKEESRRSAELGATLHATQEELAAAVARVAAMEELQSELEALRSALAEAERRVVEANRAAETARSEILSSRNALARASETLRDRAAAAEDEIRKLRSELAAARDIGRVALASLRSDARTPPEAPRNQGWLTLMLRRFGFRVGDPPPLAR